MLYQKKTYLCSILLLIHKTLHIMAKKIKKHSFILEMGVYMLFLFLFSILFNPNRSLENDKKLFLMTAIRKTALYMLDS